MSQGIQGGGGKTRAVKAPAFMELEVIWGNKSVMSKCKMTLIKVEGQDMIRVLDRRSLPPRGGPGKSPSENNGSAGTWRVSRSRVAAGSLGAEKGYSRNGRKSWLEQAWYLEMPKASGLGCREGEGEARELSRRGRRES